MISTSKLLRSSFSQHSKKLVWLDCDPGADDAMAIFLAGYSPSVNLLGISTVHGNTSLQKVTQNALKLLKIAALSNIPVYTGLSKPLTRSQDDSCTFHGDDGIGGVILPETDQKPITTDVFHSIYEQIQSYYPEKVHYVATGCLSNIALLLQTYPDIKNNIEQVSIMGGAINLGNQSPSAEFNICNSTLFLLSNWLSCYMFDEEKDPEAAKILFASGVNLAMCPLEVTHQVQVNARVKARLEAFNSEFSKNILKMLNYYADSYKQEYGFEYPPLHDPCAVYYVINPNAFETKFLNVEIETKSEFCDGRTIVDVYKVTGRKPNCAVAFSVNEDLFWEEMLDAIAKCNARSPINNQTK